MAKNADTPMMRQYREIRESLPPDSLLLFRLGDFYEMFEEDAERGARILGITLTKRHDMPMAGIPYHAADAYIGRVLEAGLKVAICDQVETPKPGKLVRRSLTRILTPGTVLEEDQLNPRANSFLLALAEHRRGLLAAWLDLSTGRFEVAGPERPEDLLSLLESLSPREVIVAADFAAASDDLAYFLGRLPVTRVEREDFVSAEPASVLASGLGVLSLDGFGLRADHPALLPAAGLWRYAESMLRGRPSNVRRLREHTLGRQVLIDAATQRNLELFRSSAGTRQGSLLACIDTTCTAAGSRLLEVWLASPSVDPGEIGARLDLVEAFRAEPLEVAALRDCLGRTRDLERIVGRLQNRIRNPRELAGIRDTLLELPAITAALDRFAGPAVAGARREIDLLPDLRDRLARTLADEPPAQLKDGHVIRKGFDEELDRLRSSGSTARQWLADLEASERARTGIRNLRIRQNAAFGFFIEVTKANLANVPDDYIRKQTMTNAERFYTPALKEKEEEILHGEERALEREEVLFGELVEAVLEASDALLRTAGALARIDLLASWGRMARSRGYCRPEVVDEPVLVIEGGRHPVIEEALRESAEGLGGATSFVPNDCRLAASGEQIALITGPNMAGKSTYIRQVALITILAHLGCFVPATACRVGRTDRIFSRVGASDELARGQSTFMVEMNETANILNNATARSLVILDEIGRGTSTFDGLSIAWAVIEHLHGEGTEGPRTLFATHYHELTRLAGTLPRLRNYSVAVREWNDEIIFAREVLPGAADKSYGIHVARLAGLPASVLERARELLENLEGGTPDGTGKETPKEGKGPRGKKDPAPESQLDLF